MSIPNLYDWIQKKQIKIDSHLKKIVQKSIWTPLLKEASLYSLEKGKRLRPLIGLLVCPDLKKISNGILDSICALELVHTYSLIHDDLPCMDDDDLRRGRPTLHKAFSESTAVLTGDALLTKAFEILSYSSYLEAEKKIALIQILSKYSGGSYLISGQILDINSSKNNLTEKLLIEINLKKTASLMIASLLFGSILSNIPQSSFPFFTNLGTNIGIYYQILDDLQDAYSSSKKISSLNMVNILGKQKTLLLCQKYKKNVKRDINKLKEYLPEKNCDLLSSLVDSWK